MWLVDFFFYAGYDIKIGGMTAAYDSDVLQLEMGDYV